MATFIRIGMLFLSWLSIIYLPKHSFKRYLPVANLATSLILITSIISVPYKLWIVEKGGLKGKVFTDLSIILGPFFIGTLWIFHLTFGKFRIYLLVNIIMNLLLSYPICYILQKFELFKLVRFKPIYIFITYVLYSIILYGFQLFLDKPRNSKNLMVENDWKEQRPTALTREALQKI